MSYDRKQLMTTALATTSISEGLVLIAMAECERAFEEGAKGEPKAFTTQFQSLFDEFLAKRGVDSGKPADPQPIPMIITCPTCGVRHIDEGVWTAKPHRTHVCHNCGLPWRVALVPTVGVKFLPGYLNEGDAG